MSISRRREEHALGRVVGRVVFVRLGHFSFHSSSRSRRAWRKAFERARPCDPSGTIAKLSGIPQPPLLWWERWLAVLATPFKFLGVSGWADTGCAGSGRGFLVRDAQHSSDGFWTLDVALEIFDVGGVDARYGRFLRLEIEPGTRAHVRCEERPPRDGETVLFGGPIVVDEDGPFLECHPAENFSRELRITSRESMKTTALPGA